MTQQRPGNDVPSSSLPGCAVVMRRLGGDPGGTATVMRSWLLIEQPGPWPSGALEQVLAEAFPPEQCAWLDRLRVSHGLRPLLIRRPGRHHREPVPAPRTVLVGGDGPGGRWLERLEVGDLRELAALDLDAVAHGRGGVGEPVTGPVFLVCTHGTKDMCCALLGRPVVDALAANHPDRTWEVSHVGGDRWAGNLLVVPDGFLHGHLTPGEASGVAKAALNGQVNPDQLRGRTATVSPWSQYAEVAVRRRTGLRGLDDVVALDEAPLPHHNGGGAAGANGTAGPPDGGRDGRVVTVRAATALLEVAVYQRHAATQDRSRCSDAVAPGGYTAEIIPAAGT